jgi:hypothetical protein
MAFSSSASYTFKSRENYLFIFQRVESPRLKASAGPPTKGRRPRVGVYRRSKLHSEKLTKDYFCRLEAELPSSEQRRSGTRWKREAAMVAVGLRQREPMANAAIRTVAAQAGLDEFDAAHRYAREQRWLVEAGKVFSTMLTPAGSRAARGE